MHIFSIFVFYMNICVFMRFLKTYLFKYILHLSILNHVYPKGVQSNSMQENLGFLLIKLPQYSIKCVRCILLMNTQLCSIYIIINLWISLIHYNQDSFSQIFLNICILFRYMYLTKCCLKYSKFLMFYVALSCKRKCTVPLWVLFSI